MNVAFLLDVALIVLFSLCVLSGWKRGFIKVAGGLIALVAATVVSALLSPVVTPVLMQFATELPAPLASLLCSMVLFLAVYVAALFLVRGLDFIAKLPLLKQANQLLGLAVGVLSGALWVLFATGVMTALSLLGTVSALNPLVLADTQVYSWIVSALPSLLYTVV